MSVEVTAKPPANAPENQQMDSGADKPRTAELSEENIEKNQANMAKLSPTTDDEDKNPVKNGKKRIIHNEVERRRKGKINNHIFTLAKLLPNKDCKKLSKNEVLLKAIDYINQIKENHEKILIGKMSEVQASEFTSMKKRIEDLEKQNSQFVKLLEIAGFPSGTNSGTKNQSDKMINKIDPASIVMNDKGEIDVVKSKNQINKLNAKRCGSVDSYSSTPKKKLNTKISDSSAEDLKSTANFCENEIIILSPDPTPPSSEKNDSMDSVTDMMTTSPPVTLPSVPSTTSVPVSHPNLVCTKEPVIGTMNGVTAVTHSLQGGPIMSTSQSSPHLQLQPTTAMVSQIPMLNFGGTVNLMQGAQMQPVITINDQGIQVIQMMTTQNGQMMVNPNNSSNSNVLLTSNSNPGLVQPGNNVQIDCPPGSTEPSATIPIIQQTVCGGSLIAQNTQYMTNPQVHLMTNSPPANPNHGNVMLGASVPGAPHANTLLTLNSNSSSNQLPSALMLPNGQIIPVMREPQLPLIYQNQTQINGSLLMAANTNQNSTCAVFGSNPVGPISSRNCSVVNVTTASGSTNGILTHINSSKTETITTTAVSVSVSQNVVVTQSNSTNENSVKDSSTLNTKPSDEPIKQCKTPKTSNLVNATKKKNKTPVINRTQRNIKPKSACDSSASQSTSQASTPNVNRIAEAEKIDRPSSTSSKSPANVAASELITSTSTTPTVASTTLTTAEKQGVHKAKASEERVGSSEKTMQTTPTISTSSCPPNTMTDILAQATESIFANSISDISNSPNPTYFNTCAINSGENVDFLNSISEAPKTGMQAPPPSTTYSNVLSMSSNMTSAHDSMQISSNKSGIRRNSTAEILGDLVGEVYRTQRSLTSNSFEGENQSMHSNPNGRMAGVDVLKSKRSNSEDEILSSKRNKMQGGNKFGSDDVTLTSTTASNSSVSFLSVSQLASSASVNSGSAPANASNGASSYSNSVNSAAMPFSIDTANSTDNSPLCSISPLLNSPNKSNDIFALSSSISVEEPHFNGNLGGNINNHNNNNEILNGNSGPSNHHNGAISITPSTSTNITFPLLSESTFVNHPVSASASTFTLPDLSGLSQNNNLELHNNYKTFSYPTNQASRPNLNAILNFQSNDSLGFALSNSINQECLMEKTMKSPNFDFRMRPHPVSRVPNSSHGGVNVTASSLHFSSVGAPLPPAQVNRFQSYSSIPLSHPASSPSRMNSSTPNALNIDVNQSGELSCSGGANKNKSGSPRQSENNMTRQLNDLNAGCLQRSSSIHHLPRSSSNHHLDNNTIDQSIIVCSVANHSESQHQSHNYNNNNNNINANQRIHSVNRQSPQMCAGSSPSPKPAMENRSPLNNLCSGGNNSNNVSPKLSPIGHSNSRSSSHSSTVGHHPAAPFLHQRSPNLDLPLITSFSTESIAMHNVSSNTRRESMFPPGQKQLTHPPLGMIQTSNSSQPPRAAISYSAESLIQTQDNSNHNRPNCARENHSASSQRQTQSMHNSGSVSSSHSLPFMHGAHLNRTNENNQQMGFPYFPFQQSGEQTSHLLQLKPNQIQGNNSGGNKNSLQSTQPQPNFSFSLMPPGSHQLNSETQSHHIQDQQNQQHQRHGNYLSMGNYGQVTPPMPGLESHKDLQVPRPPMTFSCIPPFASSQSTDQGVANVRHRHSASFLTAPNRDHAIMSSPFPDSYPAGQGSSLSSLSSNGNLVPLPIQGSDKGAGYKSRSQNVNKADGGKLSKSKQSQSGKKKNQQYQIEEVNLSNSIFETGRSTTPYFAIPNLSPPRNNEGPTYIPNNNPLFNKSRAGKNNSSNSGGNNHSKGGDSYNTLFHARTQSGFNLNFQAPSFGMNHLNAEVNSGGSAVNQIGGPHINSAPPPPPLVTSSSSHVPNFNLSNIFPDINSTNESLNMSPIKFHGNHILPPPPTPGTTQTTVDGHTLQHSQSGTLYHSNRGHHPPPPPPPPPGIHNGMTINSILSHSPHSFDGRTQMPVGINNTMTPWSWASNIQ